MKPRLRAGSRRIRLAVGAVLVTGTMAAVVLSWSSDLTPPPRTPAPVTAANISGYRTACLAADSGDTSANLETEPIWTAMQAAARGRSLNVQRLVIAIPTGSQADPYLAGLVAQRCDLIVSVGPTFTAAVPAVAKNSPATQFVAVLDPAQTAPPGVETATGTTDAKAIAIRERVLQLVRT